MQPPRRRTPTPRSAHSFTARDKLTRGAEFDAVFKNGRRSADPLFTVLFLTSDAGHPRLGITASAKRVRTAVNRNRIRRVIRESFRHAVATLPALDVVIIVKDGARDAGNPALFASLARHWAELQRRAPRAATPAG